MVISDIKNHNANIHLIQKGERARQIPGLGHNNHSRITDTEVRSLRIRFLINHEDIRELANEFGIKESYARQIVKYERRLSAACEI